MSQRPSMILVVDDEPGVRAVLLRVLAKEGYEVRVAANGREALELIRAGPLPDAIILDYLMPEMTGYELLGELRKDAVWAAIPVIGLSGVGADPGASGVAATLAKPFSMAEVRAAVSDVLAPRDSAAP